MHRVHYMHSNDCIKCVLQIAHQFELSLFQCRTALDTQLSNDPGIRQCQNSNHCGQWGAAECSLNVCELQGRLRYQIAASRCYSLAHLETWSGLIDGIRQ